MPLMGKKPPTAQELYRARKQREEDEREALLPPGLVNHGNTCFMNSVLQGLIATPVLSDIIRFSLPDSYHPMSSRRSPQLTNGHGRGGVFERDWEPGMPLGDIFTLTMEKAWRYQEEQRRTSLTPREILQRLGAKYDQYLDFRQQDAHELLRHLLDAMRMEEWDIIKKRQPPPPPKAKRQRKSSRSPAAHASTSLGNSSDGHVTQNSTVIDAGPSIAPIPESERLISFVDMVFGGTLASILVCEKCKKISCTYEDFNDLSLSIKPEDYAVARARAKAWRRERLKGFAKKLKTGVAGVGSNGKSSGGVKKSDEEKDKEKGKERQKEKGGIAKRTGGMLGLALTVPPELDAEIDNAFRASSVPTSPTRRSLELERVVSIGDGSRRRSLDFDREESGVPLSGDDRYSFSTINGAVSEGAGAGYGSRHLRDGATAGALSETEVEVISASDADESNPTDPEERERQRTESNPDVPQTQSNEKDRVSWKVGEKIEANRKYKEKDEELDGWVKLGRRISMSLTPNTKKGKKEGKTKEKERWREAMVSKKVDSEVAPMKGDDRTESHTSKDVPLPTASTDSALVAIMPASARPLLTPSASTSVIPKFALHRPSPSRATTSASPALEQKAPLASGSASAFAARSSSPSARSSSPLQLGDIAKAALERHREKDGSKTSQKQKVRDKTKQKRERPKTKRKATREEGEYLRRLLADIPSTSSPFHMFRNNSTSAADTGDTASPPSNSSTGGGLSFGLSHSLSFWTRMGNVQSVEDCLRMFTAVEVLDGENMVRCRRCWKLQNGMDVISRKGGKSVLEENREDDCETESSSDEDGSAGRGLESDNEDEDEPKTARLTGNGTFRASPASTVAPSHTPLSTLDLDEGASIHSAPTTRCTDSTVIDSNASLPATIASPSVPAIYMTAMDSSTTVVSHASSTAGGDGKHNPTGSPMLQATPNLTSPSKDSLQLPKPTLRRSNKRDANRRVMYAPNAETSASSLNGSDGESDDGESSDDMSASAASGQVSARSSTSYVALTIPDASPSIMASSIESVQITPLRPSISKPTPLSLSPTNNSIVPQSKQHIARRAYKRYLIAQPPPVLVIHLKRFQQVGKIPAPAQLQFFANFKKLDDPVVFTEYLDLAPFLVPRKEEFGLKSKKGEKQAWSAKEGDGRCMYRLYAVVVHIGNMLGGHYIAYTALPDSGDLRASKESPVVTPFEKDSPSPSDKNVSSPTPTGTPKQPFSRTASFEIHSDPKHSGRPQGTTRKWCYISDTVVRLTTLEEVMKSKAYICMYERI